MSDIELASITPFIAELGFPIVAAVGLVYFVHYVWKFVTETLGPKLDDKQAEIELLNDTVQDLEKDLVRLHEKLETISEFRTQK